MHQLQAEYFTRSSLGRHPANALSWQTQALQKQEDPLAGAFAQHQMGKCGAQGHGSVGDLAGWALWLGLTIFPSFYDTSVYYNFRDKQEEK